MDPVPGSSVELVVTSPPYPMIEMWDESFARQSTDVDSALEKSKGFTAFECMHRILDSVWDEVVRVLKPGGLACINIGDAVRKIGGSFCLYPNHARILSSMQAKGLFPLPAVIWRKQTNAPNKFMGSGMLPAGAYVTLEHEYVLIMRKGGKREFKLPREKEARRRSALFWEERNLWFSDIWTDLKGARQRTSGNPARNRSGAFPFELPYRLINMYSVAGDTVLDPFAGSGTTMFAAMASARSFIGFEIEEEFVRSAAGAAPEMAEAGGRVVSGRLARHEEFVKKRLSEGREIKYTSRVYGFPVMTRQETDICLYRPARLEKEETFGFSVLHEAEIPHNGSSRSKEAGAGQGRAAAFGGKQGRYKQRVLF